MKLSRRLLVYAVCAVVVAAAAPMLSFRYVAAAGVILAGLALVDVIQYGRGRL